MNKPRADRQKITEQWRGRLDNAKLKLDFARSYKKEVEQDFPPGETPTPDGTLAHHNALRAENMALAEYNRVLRIFSHLVLHGEVPDEGDWARGTAPSAGWSEDPGAD